MVLGGGVGAATASAQQAQGQASGSCSGSHASRQAAREPRLVTRLVAQAVLRGEALPRLLRLASVYARLRFARMLLFTVKHRSKNSAS